MPTQSLVSCPHKLHDVLPELPLLRRSNHRNREPLLVQGQPVHETEAPNIRLPVVY